MPRKRRKKRGANRLQIRIIKGELPAGVTTAEYVAGLRRAVRTKELPSGWNIQIAWRNPNTLQGRSKYWQEGDWEDVLSASRSGFATVVDRVLRSAEAQIPAEDRAEAKRKKRSEAAKKGAETKRKEKERTEKQAAAWRRSQAARKAAATRKAKGKK